MASGQPTLSDVHVNVPLSNILIAYLQDQNEFMADKVFPAVPVQKQSDVYYTIERDAFYRSDAEERAPGTETPGTGWTLDHNGLYYCRVKGVHSDVPDQLYANADSVLNLDRINTELVTRQLLIDREQTFINNFFTTGVWAGVTGSTGTDITGVSSAPSTNQVLQWNVAGSTPIEDIKRYKRSIQQLTGLNPKDFSLVIGPYVADGLLENPEIVDRVKYTQLGFLDLGLLAEAFGVKAVYEAAAVHNTAIEGAAISMSFMYPKAALLVYSAPAPGLMVPSGGYTFGWQGYLNGDASARIKRYRMEQLASWRIEGEMAYDLRQVSSIAGIFFTSVVA